MRSLCYEKKELIRKYMFMFVIVVHNSMELVCNVKEIGRYYFACSEVPAV